MLLFCLYFDISFLSIKELVQNLFLINLAQLSIAHTMYRINYFQFTFFYKTFITSTDSKNVNECTDAVYRNFSNSIKEKKICLIF